MASAFTPKDGIVHEWITSNEKTSERIWEKRGITIRLSTSKRRNSLILEFWGVIYESNSIKGKSEYSYDQNHWCPIIFRDKIGL